MFKIREVTQETVAQDIPQVLQVLVQSSQTTYLGLLEQSSLDNLTVNNNSSNLRRDAAQKVIGIEHYLFVATLETGEIVGYAYCGRNNFSEVASDSELYNLYLRKDYQGHGIGRELFESSKNRLREQGFQTMFLWCAKETPACGFYDKMGGERVDERMGHLLEIGFAWKLK
jgi:ribosomal protein S18 acetylase RimI-like enzyme